MFFDRFDLGRIGVFGHSGGANASAQLAKKDKRVKANTPLPTVTAIASNREFARGLDMSISSHVETLVLCESYSPVVIRQGGAWDQGQV